MRRRRTLRKPRRRPTRHRRRPTKYQSQWRHPKLNPTKRSGTQLVDPLVPTTPTKRSGPRLSPYSHLAAAQAVMSGIGNGGAYGALVGTGLGGTLGGLEAHNLYHGLHVKTYNPHDRYIPAALGSLAGAGAGAIAGSGMGAIVGGIHNGIRYNLDR